VKKKEVLIRRLRNYFQLPESIASDKELLRVTKRTMARRHIELGIEIENLGQTIAKEIENTWIGKLIGNLL